MNSQRINGQCGPGQVLHRCLLVEGRAIQRPSLLPARRMLALLPRSPKAYVQFGELPRLSRETQGVQGMCGVLTSFLYLTTREASWYFCRIRFLLRTS